MMNVRLSAATILSRVIKEGQSLTVALDHTFESIAEQKDRAFIQALCYGVVRYYYRLDDIVQQLLSKSLRSKDTDIKMLLLIGIYQLKYMRVKRHAAVSETVSAASKKKWAKSLINGVLRQYIREQEALEKKADESIVTLFAHPQWMVDVFKKDWPEQAQKVLLENNQPPPMSLRVNLAQNSREDYLKLLAEHSIQASSSHLCSTAIVLKEPRAVEKLPGFSDGLVSVQDVAAQLAAEILDVQAGQSVLDICAAPGGKTAAILERQTKPMSMLAVDIDEKRLARVADNIQRLKLQANLVVGDASKPEQWVKNQMFERILVDAPCSALGVIRRHPDIKVLRRESDILALQLIQQQILQAAWQLLVPSGVLVYATCSILEQENEGQIEIFLKDHENAQEVPINAEWGIARRFGRQILTGDSGMDGFYYAKLVKSL
jgi:16S rRNA (cytosine967-C5)-methyltransferase